MSLKDDIELLTAIREAQAAMITKQHTELLELRGEVNLARAERDRLMFKLMDVEAEAKRLRLAQMDRDIADDMAKGQDELIRGTVKTVVARALDGQLREGFIQGMVEAQPLDPDKVRNAFGWNIPATSLPIMRGHTADANPIAKLDGEQRKQISDWLMDATDTVPAPHIKVECAWTNSAIQAREAAKTHSDACICEPCMEAKRRVVEKLNALRGGSTLVTYDPSKHSWCPHCGNTGHLFNMGCPGFGKSGKHWRYFAGEGA